MLPIQEHYLVKSEQAGFPYYSEFLETGSILVSLLTEKAFKVWLEEKMFLNGQPQEKTFIQFAVETAVARFFGEKYPENFQVEVKINPNNDKDVDCRFTDGAFIFNLEVKYSDFVAKECVDTKDAYKYETIGRLPDRGEGIIKTLAAAIDEGLQSQGKESKKHVNKKTLTIIQRGFWNWQMKNSTLFIRN